MSRSNGNKNSGLKFLVPILGVVSILVSLLFLLSPPLLMFDQIVNNHGVYVQTKKVIVHAINPSSPAAATDLKTGDVITSVNGIQIATIQDFLNIVNKNKGKSVSITVMREGQNKTVSLIPRTNYPSNEGPTGVALTDSELKQGNPLLLTFQTFKNTGFIVYEVTQVLIIIFSIGLIMFTKWGFYGYISTQILSFIYDLWITVSNQYNLTFIYLVKIGLLVVILCFLYYQRKLFK